MSRTFAKLNAGPRDTWGLTCGACGVIATVSGQNFGKDMAQDILPKKFRAMGWEVGKRDKDDRCPSCVKRDRDARRRARLTVVEQEPPVSKSTFLAQALEAVAAHEAKQPREMSRDERRLIFAKLDEVYLDEKRGYDNGWSDKRVADDLGVPRAWVARIRDENFGPENTNPEARALVAEAKAILSDSKALLDRVDGLQRRIEAIEKQF